MLEKAPRKEFGEVLRFGSGLSSTASIDEIQPEECAAGKNYSLSLDNSHLKPRKPFAKVGTVPNTSEITGYAQLHKQDGTLSTLIQAQDKVYSWDGTTFTEVATVSSGCKLRGPLEANFTLNDEVIITDLTKTEAVKVWDGTTLSTMTTGLGSTFYAKYCFVEDERAWFANVQSGTDTPHMIVGSQRSDNTVLTVSNRPSSALNDQDPFFMLAPDLRPINGLVSAFGKVMFSSRMGSTYQVQGTTAKDFYIDPFYSGSAATGDEGVVNVGNDIFYSKSGAIETLSGLEQFGDVAVDDLTRFISEDVKSYDSFRLIYNRETQRVYCLPKDDDKMYVFHKPIYDDVVKRVSLRDKAQYRSPWMEWDTEHEATFIPSVMFNILDPTSSKMAVYFGDSSGNLYKMEGDDYDGDSGGTNITMSRTSALFKSPAGQAFDLNGWILYKKPSEDITVNLTIMWQGLTSYDNTTTITLPKIEGGAHFGGLHYFGGTDYFGVPYQDRIMRQEWGCPGRSSAFQIKVEVEGTADFNLVEVGFRFEG